MTTRERILVALSSGPLDGEMLRLVVGGRDLTVGRALMSLVAEGTVQRRSEGVYRIVPLPGARPK